MEYCQDEIFHLLQHGWILRVLWEVKCQRKILYYLTFIWNQEEREEGRKEERKKNKKPELIGTENTHWWLPEIGDEVG